MTTVDKILQELKSYKDKVVISPLSKEEVEIIQAKFKKEIPGYFKDFLLKIGLRQDLIWGLSEQIIDLGDFLPSEDYFRFGDNGGEDYWLLKFEDENDRTIYEYDFYCNYEIISLNKTFDELLFEGLEDIKKRYDDLPLNDKKDWCVQFSINTGSGRFLVTQLKDKLDFPIELIKEPEFTETSTAGVKCYEGIISINGKRVRLGKQIIKGMGSPTLYFDWQESIKDMQENSFIKKLDQALSNCVFKHSLCDYGILNREELK